MYNSLKRPVLCCLQLICLTIRRMWSEQQQIPSVMVMHADNADVQAACRHRQGSPPRRAKRGGGRPTLPGLRFGRPRSQLRLPRQLQLPREAWPMAPANLRQLPLLQKLLRPLPRSSLPCCAPGLPKEAFW